MAWMPTRLGKLKHHKTAGAMTLLMRTNMIINAMNPLMHGYTLSMIQGVGALSW